MRTLPPEPNPGDRISANLIRELIRAIRERTPISGHGVKVSIGPNGSVISSDYESVNKVKSKDKGRFKIKSLSVSDQSSSKRISLEFENCYYRIGGRTYTCQSSSVESIDLPTIVALKVDLSQSLPVESLVNYDSLSDLNSAENNTRYFISPLYKFDANGKIECDFRIGPDAGIWEFAQ